MIARYLSLCRIGEIRELLQSGFKRATPEWEEDRLSQGGRAFEVMLIGAALVIAAICGTMFVKILNNLHRDALKRSIEESTEFAAVLAGQTSRSVEAINIVLEEIAEQVRSWSPDDAEQKRLRGRDAHRYLNERKSKLPAADVVSLIGADGRLLNSTREWPALEVDLSNRDHVQASKAGKSDVIISAPAPNHLTGKHVVYFARRIESADGTFLGTANVGVQPQQLIESHAASAHVQGRALVLVRTDGIVLSHSQAPSAAGARMPMAGPWPGLVSAGGGEYRTVSTFDGVARLVAVKPMKNWPLVVNVSQSEEAALRSWYEVRRMALGFAGVGAAIAIGLMLTLLRNHRKMIEAQRLSWEWAHQDALTALPNRRALINRLELFRREGSDELRYILFIDLDRFKAVNDSLGHAFGDELLQQVAARLKGLVRKTDIVSRLGGDEFVIVAETMDDHAAAQLAERIIAEFAKPFCLSHDNRVNIGASIGIRSLRAETADASKLIDDADRALYQAKGSGRGRYRFFNPALEADALQRLNLDARMRAALERGEFELVYQPILSLKENRVVSAEALIRWNDPDSGTIMPDKFIPLAEETGFIAPLSKWVMNSALEQMAHWRTENLPLESVAVNLAFQQIENTDLISDVDALLERHALPASCLTLEVTESMAMRNEAEIKLQLTQLRRRGVTIALDDFGTGYSSLSLLRDLPIDRLKIDRSFVKDMLSDSVARTLTSAIVALAQTLQLGVVAEGIEEQEHLELLRSLGCAYAQGFFLGRPMPADALRTMLLKAEPSSELAA